MIYMIGTGKRKTAIDLRPLLLEEAFLLRHGDRLYYHSPYSGYVVPVRVASRIKTWKRYPNKIEFSVKYGLYEVVRVNENDIANNRLLVESGQEIIPRIGRYI